MSLSYYTDLYFFDVVMIWSRFLEKITKFKSLQSLTSIHCLYVGENRIQKFLYIDSFKYSDDHGKDLIKMYGVIILSLFLKNYTKF